MPLPLCLLNPVSQCMMEVVHVPTNGGSLSLDRYESDFFQIHERRIVVRRISSGVVIVPWRNDDNHPLSCTRQEYAVCVFQIRLSFRLTDIHSHRSPKSVVLPSSIAVAEICVPRNASPVE